jgi:hypothetical protein
VFDFIISVNNIPKHDVLSIKVWGLTGADEEL